jgi:hypothetical protein
MAIEKQKVKTKFYTMLKEVGPNDKCPPQAKLIMDTIQAAGGRIEREALIQLLKRPVDQGGLKTNQTAERILGFYRPRLADMGVLKEETEETEIEVEVPDKPEASAEVAADGAAPAEGTDPAPDPVKGAKGKRKAA